jgi:hypothetical protein
MDAIVLTLVRVEWLRGSRLGLVVPSFCCSLRWQFPWRSRHALFLRTVDHFRALEVSDVQSLPSPT